MMTQDQIAEELRTLSDSLDRLDTFTEGVQAQVTLVHERTIPSIRAEFAHTLGGTDVLVANLAGTVEKLAITIGSLSDRLILLERHWE